MEKDIQFNILLLLNNALDHPPFMDNFYPNIKVAHPTYRPKSYSDFQEIFFISHILAGSTGEWQVRDNLGMILKGLQHLQRHKNN